MPPPPDVGNTRDSRFVGDLNPESIFIAATSDVAKDTASEIGDVGIWSWQREGVVHSNQDTEISSDLRRRKETYSSEHFLGRQLLPSLEKPCLSILPRPADFAALSQIYFQKFNSIFPIVDKEIFLKMDRTRSTTILLSQGICLAASASTAAAEYLRFSSDSGTLSQSDFSHRISRAMKSSVEIGLVTEKIVIIQALVLLSLFIQVRDGGDTAAQLSGRAVHHLHTLGLHIGRRSEKKLQPDFEETLFCCVWALDRLSAAFHGRPVLMHERDIGHDLEACFQNQSPCFRLLLKVISALDCTIELYRPKAMHNQSSRAIDFPDYEDLLIECGASREDMTLLGKFFASLPSHIFESLDVWLTEFLHQATIETLYQAISILSCRSSASNAVVRHAPGNIRMLFSAARITSIVSEEFSNRLSLFPFVPYAVSLSLSVAYQELRRSSVPMYQARARKQLQVNCNILKELTNVFWSASVMANMGEQVLEEMDKILRSLTERRQSSANDGTTVQVAPSADDTDAVSLTQPVGNTTTTSTTTNDNMNGLLNFEPSLFENIPDQDIFGQFDPDFDLEAFDAALGGGYLDMSLPANFENF